MAINNKTSDTVVPFGPSAPWGRPAWQPPAWACIVESAHVSVETYSALNPLAPAFGPYQSSSFRGAKPLDLNAVNEALIKFQKMSVNNPNMFPAFMDNSPSSTNLAGLPRQPPSPIAQHQVNPQVNGAGMNGMNGMNVALPMNAGHQMDLNVLFNQVEELSQLLKENREKTQAIIATAEELAVSWSCYCHGSKTRHFGSGALLSKYSLTAVFQTRAAVTGTAPTLEQANSEITGMDSSTCSEYTYATFSKSPC